MIYCVHFHAARREWIEEQNVDVAPKTVHVFGYVDGLWYRDSDGSTQQCVRVGWCCFFCCFLRPHLDLFRFVLLSTVGFHVKFSGGAKKSRSLITFLLHFSPFILLRRFPLFVRLIFHSFTTDSSHCRIFNCTPKTQSGVRTFLPHTFSFNMIFAARCYTERGYEIVMSSVCLSVRPSVRDVDGSFQYRLEYFENNFTAE